MISKLSIVFMKAYIFRIYRQSFKIVNIFTIFIKYCENETIGYIFKNNYKNT